jgi:glycosyltransferase involved in cell wall biosynthesis
LKVVHLEAGTHLYGGALQVLLLAEGLQEREGIQNILVVPRGSKVQEEAERRGLPVRAIPMAGEADLAFPFRFKKLLKEEAPELVHLHSRRGADTLGALTTKLAGIPTVLSRRVDNPEAGWSLAAKYRMYDKVITISQAIRRVLVAQGVPAEKVVCVHSALDPSPYLEAGDAALLRREFGISKEERVVAMAAQFIQRKGHAILLDAVPSVLSSHPNTRFILFGQGPLRSEMEARVEAEGLGRVVTFAGFRDDLHKLLPAMELLVHPATKEGLGIILLQASASGLPIVATRAGGIPEAVVDGVTGLLVQRGDPGALSQAISSLLGDPARAHEMGRAGRAMVEKSFSVERMVKGNLEVYQALTG